MIDKKVYDDIMEALMKKAMGYEYEETTIIATQGGKVVSIKKTKKHEPPDRNALRLLKRYYG